MKKRLIPIIILIAYIAILIKVMVFKDIPTIRVGQLMLNFGGTDGGRPANFVPFRTIIPYLLGYKGWIIAGINLIGNIALLVPIGFIVPFVCRSMTWKKSLVLAVVSGVAIETMQFVLRVGIFDIDDVILNALGVMIGFWAFLILAKWLRERKYKTIVVAALVVIAAAVAAFYAIYPHGQQLMNPGTVNSSGATSQGDDLCGGTGGTGQIVSTGNNTITIRRKDGSSQIVSFTSKTSVRTSAGPASPSDLKIGDSVTLVGGPNPDGSFTADAVFVCNASSSGTQSGQ